MLRSLLLFLPVAFLPAQTPNPASAILEGSVVNAVNNAPIAGARIRLNYGLDEPVFARADQEGHFVLTNLKLGGYSLSVESPGSFGCNLGSLVLRDTTGRGMEICGGTFTITDTGGVLHVKLTVPLQPAAVISGKVTDPYGVPMVDCEIRVFTKGPVARPAVKIGNSEIREVAGAKTDDRGEFRVARLQPGTYWVAAYGIRGIRGTWDSSFRTTYYPATPDAALAKPIELAAGQQARAEIQVVRQEGVRVAGHLARPADLQKDFLVSITVMLAPEQEQYAMQVRDTSFSTTSDRFELKDVPPGRYHVIAVVNDSNGPLAGDRKATFGARKAIEVGDQDLDGIDLALDRLPDLAGVVTFGQGCRPEPVEIHFDGSPRVWGDYEATSGADGKFELKGLPPDKWTVRVSSGWPASSIQLGDRDVMKDGFETPYMGNEPLRIAIDCSAQGRTR